MGIGACVFLLAVGAVLAFAVNATVSGLDINVVGWILMGAGVLGLFFTTLIFGRRDEVVGTTTTAPVTEERISRRYIPLRRRAARRGGPSSCPR
jgi:hypothetical protein